MPPPSVLLSHMAFASMAVIDLDIEMESPAQIQIIEDDESTASGGDAVSIYTVESDSDSDRHSNESRVGKLNMEMLHMFNTGVPNPSLSVYDGACTPPEFFTSDAYARSLKARFAHEMSLIDAACGSIPVQDARVQKRAWAMLKSCQAQKTSQAPLRKQMLKCKINLKKAKNLLNLLRRCQRQRCINSRNGLMGM